MRDAWVTLNSHTEQGLLNYAFRAFMYGTSSDHTLRIWRFEMLSVQSHCFPTVLHVQWYSLHYSSIAVRHCLSSRRGRTKVR
jgi:hypothetical protein